MSCVLQAGGFTSLAALLDRAGWTKPRAEAALDMLLRQVRHRDVKVYFQPRVSLRWCCHLRQQTRRAPMTGIMDCYEMTCSRDDRAWPWWTMFPVETACSGSPAFTSATPPARRPAAAQRIAARQQ